MSTCRNCAYEWSPRISDPKACPRCKSRQDVPQKLAPVDRRPAKADPATISATRSSAANTRWAKIRAKD